MAVMPRHYNFMKRFHVISLPESIPNYVCIPHSWIISWNNHGDVVFLYPLEDEMATVLLVSREERPSDTWPMSTGTCKYSTSSYIDACWWIGNRRDYKIKTYSDNSDGGNESTQNRTSCTSDHIPFTSKTNESKITSHESHRHQAVPSVSGERNPHEMEMSLKNTQKLTRPGTNRSALTVSEEDVTVVNKQSKTVRTPASSRNVLPNSNLTTATTAALENSRKQSVATKQSTPTASKKDLTINKRSKAVGIPAYFQSVPSNSNVTVATAETIAASTAALENSQKQPVSTKQSAPTASEDHTRASGRSVPLHSNTTAAAAATAGLENLRKQPVETKQSTPTASEKDLTIINKQSKTVGITAFFRSVPSHSNATEAAAATAASENSRKQPVGTKQSTLTASEDLAIINKRSKTVGIPDYFRSIPSHSNATAAAAATVAASTAALENLQKQPVSTKQSTPTASEKVNKRSKTVRTPTSGQSVSSHSNTIAAASATVAASTAALENSHQQSMAPEGNLQNHRNLQITGEQVRSPDAELAPLFEELGI